MGGREGDAQRARRQQHDRVRRVRALCEILGVAGEGHAGIGDDAFVHRRGDHGIELTGERPIDRAVEELEHVGGIARIQPSRCAR